MRTLMCLFIFVVIVGCTPTKVKISKPLQSVGIIVNSDSNSICYNYTGITAFQNSKNKYEFTTNFEDLVTSELNNALELMGIKTVIINPENISPTGFFIKYSSWDSSQQLLPEYKEKFVSEAQAHNLDAIFVLTHETSKLENEACSGSGYVDSSIYGLYFSGGSIGIFTSSGEFSGDLPLRIKVSSQPLARQPKTLSEIYIQELERLLKRQIRSEVSQKIN